jgi:hypothetical protein
MRVLRSICLKWHEESNDLFPPCSSRYSAIQVLPLGKELGQGQRVVVGDTAGVLQCFYYRNNVLMQVFKGVPGPEKLNCVVSGVGPTQRDKAFVAEGSVVRRDRSSHSSSIGSE